MTVTALVADPAVPLTMRLADVPDPQPSPSQVVVHAVAAALNHGDLNDASSARVAPGSVLGSDVAGIVVKAAEDGSGPRVGARVVALAQGAFAEDVAVATSSLAIVPDRVDLAVAAAVPVAGLAAFRSLRRSGSLTGRRVLITGAGGGVGTFAIQLATAQGAHVIASIGSPARAVDLKALGADDVVVNLEGVEAPVDVVIDSVGGPQLVRAWELLAPGGVVQSIGCASGEPAVFPPYSTIGPTKTLMSYLTSGPFGEDLADLMQLLAVGVLSAPVGWQGGLPAFGEAVTALRERRLHGKAILNMNP